MPPVVTRAEYLTIDGVPSNTPGWEVTDLSPLWDGPDVKGGDRDLPGGGAVPYPRRPTITVRDLPIKFFADALYDGTVTGTGRERLRANVAYFRANVVDPKTTGDGTRTLVLYVPGGSTVSAPVTVISPLQLGPVGPASQRGTLRLSFPQGGLA